MKCLQREGREERGFKMEKTGQGINWERDREETSLKKSLVFDSCLIRLILSFFFLLIFRFPHFLVYVLSLSHTQENRYESTSINGNKSRLSIPS